MSVPLGKIDLPSEQRQINYDYHVIKQSHTVIFGSPGYGKTTVLQTLIMNLARANTPEQVQFNLLDFGNNGLLPLVKLPHVMDIAALEDDEKLQKMLSHILNILSQRKQMFKSVGVSNLVQYEQKTQCELPINIVIVDNYDGMTTTDTRKEKLDQILLQVLREGASLGVYLILTANRTGSIRMNMMSTLATKMLLYLNDDYEVTTIMRKDSVIQQAINGRGQIMLDTPTAIQYYLPVFGKSTVDILIQLEKEISRMNAEWKGPRPSSIPMVPKALSMQIFNQYIKKTEQNTLYIGLDKQRATVESFQLFQGQALGIFWATLKQCHMLIPRLLHQIKTSSTKEFIIIDMLANLKSYQSLASVYIDKNSIINQKEDLKQALSYLLIGNSVKRVIVINGFSELVTKLGFTPEQVVEILTYAEATCQFIIIDQVSKIGHNYGGITTIVREYLPHIIFGGDLQQQHLIETLTAEQKRQNYPYHIMHRLIDNTISTIVLPTEDEV